MLTSPWALLRLKKALKIEKCSKCIMELILRKSLVLESKKTQTNKTFMASKRNFKTHFGVFWSNFISYNSVLPSVHLISWFEIFSRFIRNQTCIIFFILIYSPSHSSCLVSEIGIRFSVTDLIRTNSCFADFILSSPWKYQKTHHVQANFNLFPKTGVISTSIRVREVW